MGGKKGLALKGRRGSSRKGCRMKEEKEEEKRKKPLLQPDQRRDFVSPQRNMPHPKIREPVKEGRNSGRTIPTSASIGSSGPARGECGLLHEAGGWLTHKKGGEMSSKKKKSLAGLILEGRKGPVARGPEGTTIKLVRAGRSPGKKPCLILGGGGGGGISPF